MSIVFNDKNIKSIYYKDKNINKILFKDKLIWALEIPIYFYMFRINEWKISTEPNKKYKITFEKPSVFYAGTYSGSENVIPITDAAECYFIAKSNPTYLTTRGKIIEAYQVSGGGETNP